MSMSQFMDNKEFSEEQMRDQLWSIKYDIEKILEKTEGQRPEEFNFSLLEEFLSSITTESIHARKLVNRLKQEVKNGKDT